MQSLAIQVFVAACLSTLALAQDLERITRDLAGKVIGATPGAPVMVTVWHDDMERDVLQPIAEGLAKDGSFAFSGVPWFHKQQWGSHKIVLIARCGTGKNLRICAREFRSDTLELACLDVTLTASIELRGTILDEATGEPIPNAWVWPAILGSGKDQVWLTQPMLAWRALTDENGNFVMPGLPDLVPIKLKAGGENHATAWVDVGNRAKVVAMLAPGCSIQGTVLSPSGKPASRVAVFATGRGVGYGRAHTDEEGRFKLSGLPADEYKLFAKAKDLTVIAVLGINMNPGDALKKQVVQLVHGGFIVGRILDAKTGKPVLPGPSTDVAMYGPARGPGGSCEATPVLADGTFRIRAPEGTNRIYLRGGSGYSKPSEEVEVIEGEETLVVWKLQLHK